jgi:hypothetical protein
MDHSWVPPSALKNPPGDSVKALAENWIAGIGRRDQGVIQGPVATLGAGIWGASKGRS